MKPLLLAAWILAIAGGSVSAQPGTVLGQQKVSTLQGTFAGPLADGDRFGASVALVGDLDGDGTGDLAVGASADADGGFPAGAVWVLYLRPDGTVRAEQKISVAQGLFAGPLDPLDQFGAGAAGIGDLDLDSVPDLAVGAPGDDDGPPDGGAVWVLRLRPDGTPKSFQKISATSGAFTGPLAAFDGFGASVTSLGDLDGNSIADLAVGAPGDDGGGLDRGAVWILFLSPAGSVSSQRKIGSGAGGFPGLDDFDAFGSSVARVGDLDGDGVTELAVGAPGDDDGGTSRGAAWILFLNADGSVKSRQKISSAAGGFTGALTSFDRFGFALAPLGDLDGDRVADLAVGAPNLGLLVASPGSVYTLRLRSNGTVKSHAAFGAGQGGFSGALDPSDFFGSSLASLGDLDGDGRVDLAVGATGDDDGGAGTNAERGAVWQTFLDAFPKAAATVFGCGVNPPGSLVVLNGLPKLGTLITLGIDNPLGTQASGAISFLAMSVAPDPAFPCGTSVPGIGMGGPGAPGELLIVLSGVNPIVVGPPWSGPGNPAPITLFLPLVPSLFGARAYAQGALFDLGVTFGVGLAVSDAVELRIGL